MGVGAIDNHIKPYNITFMTNTSLTTQSVTKDTNEALKQLTKASGVPATRILESLVYVEYQAMLNGKQLSYPPAPVKVRRSKS